MSENPTQDAMLDMYIFETTQLLEQLEQLVIDGEKTSSFRERIDEIFRIMHTIKGSSAMMFFTNIAELSHTVEDLFFCLRDNPDCADYRMVSDIVLDATDFMKVEVAKISDGAKADGDASVMIGTIGALLRNIKESGGTAGKSADSGATNDRESEDSWQRQYEAVVYFREGCEMEDVRAFGIVQKLAGVATAIQHIPANLTEDDPLIVAQIRKNGFKVCFDSNLATDDLRAIFEKTAFVDRLELSRGEQQEEPQKDRSEPQKPASDALGASALQNAMPEPHQEPALKEKDGARSSNHQGMISVNIAKTDRLMNLMGEMIIAEAMVTQSPELKDLKLVEFQKAARQLRKITHEMQDAVMSIRMVPLATTFLKMHRIVRDMSQKMNKQIYLEVVGEETEVDKNIIEHISDPLMHLVRNSIDHGIEDAGERVAKDKPQAGKITLEARNAGSDVLVLVKDDGKGLNKERILRRAAEKGLLQKSQREMNDKEIFNLIFLPGFSTKDKVTEFSGRGVGMDVVTKNIETVGGSVSVESTPGEGTTVTLKIPLTLAIIDGMNIRVGNARFTLPTIAIKESFRPKEQEIFKDLDGNEMIMVRGQCYPILRLHEHFQIPTAVTAYDAGILMMVEQNDRIYCIFADKLVGQQQVVVKTLPNFIKKMKQIRGLAGCTLLGDGSISLILDLGGLINAAEAS